MKAQNEEGFTLIELLVVIAIIGILSGVVLASLSTARAKARDANRISDLLQLETALEMYYNDFGQYPISALNGFSSEPGDGNSNNAGNWIPGLAPTYIPTLPRDPRGGTGHPNPPCISGTWKESYIYISRDGNSYKLLAHCSPERSSWSSSFRFYDQIRPTWAWMVCGGTECRNI